MAQSRLHGVATIYTRLEGMVKVGAISNVDIPIWFNVYKRFPPRRPPDAERPLVQKPLKPILYPEDNLRAQFYKTYHNSTMSGDKGLLTAENFKGGIAEAFLNSFEIVKKLRPQYYDDDVWYLTQRWIHDGMGLTLTHRGDAVTTAEMKSVERKMTNLEFLNEEEIRNFLERIEKEELVEEEEEEDAGAR